jgi:hypothetical protein
MSVGRPTHWLCYFHERGMYAPVAEHRCAICRRIRYIKQGVKVSEIAAEKRERRAAGTPVPTRD